MNAFMHMQDGSIELCNLLVVADGVNSKLRSSIRPEDQPYYAGHIMLMVDTCRLNVQ